MCMRNNVDEDSESEEDLKWNSQNCVHILSKPNIVGLFMFGLVKIP